MNYRIASIFFFLVFISSCKNDIDILADYKETTVVYGLLNQQDSIQYIKINKTFLGEGDALQMAQVYDSTNYANQLDVKMEQWKNGTLLNTYTLQQDNTIPKDPGVFSSPYQVIYKTNTGGTALDENSEYQLIINNTSTGNTVKSKTSLVKDFSIQFPTASTTVSLTNPTFPVKIKWTSAPNGKLYQLVIRFHYVERDKYTSVSTQKYIDWNFSTQKSTSLAGGENMEIAFLGASFYQFLNANLSVNSSVYRFQGKLDFMFSAAADEFNTYMEVNTPSTGIVQEKPEYTNIENGIGIFSARYYKSVLNRPLTAPSINELYTGQYTLNLGFCDSTSAPPL